MPTAGHAGRAAGAGFALAALLTAWVLASLPSRPPEASHLDLFVAWVLAFAVYCGAALAGDRAIPPPRGAGGRPLFAVVLIALSGLGLAMRAWHLDRVPYVLSGDEANYGLEALRVLAGEIRNPFATGWMSVPTGTFFFNSATLAMFGPGVGALRLPWALVGTLTIPITGCLVARLTNRLLGAAAAALLAFYHYHIHFSRLGANQIGDPLLLSLGLLCLVRALDGGRRLDWVWTGAVPGLALYFYAGARLTAVVMLIVCCLWMLRGGAVSWRRHRRGLALAAGAFILVSAPMLERAWRFPDDFNARLNEVGIVQSGWLAREMERRSSGAVPILAEQLGRAVLAFNVYPDRTVWYGLPQPLLDPVFGVVFLLGLSLATIESVRPQGQPRVLPMVVWWWSGTVLGGMMTVDPPSSMRLVTLTVPVCFFIAYGLQRLFALVPQLAQARPRALAMGMSVVAFAAVSLHLYFVDFSPRRLAGGRHAEMATEVARVLQARTDTTRVVVMGAPAFFASFPTWHYLAPRVSFEDVLEPLRIPPDAAQWQADANTLFVVAPERADEIAVLRATFPHGTAETVRSGADGRLLAMTFWVPAERR